MNVIARLEYELAYYDPAVHRFNHYTTRTPPSLSFSFSLFISYLSLLHLSSPFLSFIILLNIHFLLFLGQTPFCYLILPVYHPSITFSSFLHFFLSSFITSCFIILFFSPFCCFLLHSFLLSPFLLSHSFCSSYPPLDFFPFLDLLFLLILSHLLSPFLPAFVSFPVAFSLTHYFFLSLPHFYRLPPLHPPPSISVIPFSTTPLVSTSPHSFSYLPFIFSHNVNLFAHDVT